jgi:glycosyltransferase involved in cell wall biosynthesis
MMEHTCSIVQAPRILRDEARREIANRPTVADGSLELSVVMPCLNEDRTVGVCVAKALRTMAASGIVGEVLVVDNGSTDRSVEVASDAGARVVHQPLRGYGNALRKGFAEARGRFVIMADCDDSYDVTDLERFVVRLRNGADLVMGNRLAGEIKPGAMPWHHRWIGNPLLSWFLNRLFHTGVGDTHCGMRGFVREAMEKVGLRMPGMEMASEMVIKSSLAGLRVEELPITLYPDGRNRRPHLRSFRDGWRHLRFMLMCSPVFLFILPGLLLTLCGLAAIPAVVLAGYGVFTDMFGPTFMYTASLLAIAGSHLLVFGFLAKLYTHHVDPVFQDPRVTRLLSRFTVERGLAVGLGLCFCAAMVSLPVLFYWLRTATVFSPARWIFGGTLFTLGMEAVFTSFLVGILDLPREGSRSG